MYFCFPLLPFKPSPFLCFKTVEIRRGPLADPGPLGDPVKFLHQKYVSSYGNEAQTTRKRLMSQGCLQNHKHGSYGNTKSEVGLGVKGLSPKEKKVKLFFGSKPAKKRGSQRGTGSAEGPVSPLTDFIVVFDTRAQRGVFRTPASRGPGGFF